MRLRKIHDIFSIFHHTTAHENHPATPLRSWSPARVGRALRASRGRRRGGSHGVLALPHHHGRAGKTASPDLTPPPPATAPNGSPGPPFCLPADHHLRLRKRPDIFSVFHNANAHENHPATRRRGWSPARVGRALRASRGKRPGGSHGVLAPPPRAGGEDRIPRPNPAAVGDRAERFAWPSLCLPADHHLRLRKRHDIISVFHHANAHENHPATRRRGWLPARVGRALRASRGRRSGGSHGVLALPHHRGRAENTTSPDLTPPPSVAAPNGSPGPLFAFLPNII